jgi:hypothetical protein
LDLVHARAQVPRLGLFGQKQVGAVGTVFETKENCMNWLKLKLRNWVNSAQDIDAPETVYATKSSNRLVSCSDIDSEEGLSITVRSAIGGRIVTFRHYDRKTDRSNHRLYIVPEDQDFERELGKMITLESMRG